VAEIAPLKYRAFLSYSHRDARWAKWLHSALEGYRLDKDLVGRNTSLGPVPKTLRPIFRDCEDFSSGRSLTDATVAALDASAALIVLCSTAAATRPAVNEEVRLFRSRHPERPVILVIIEGAWPRNFPPALHHELAADGTVTDQPITILGPDLRESGDGRNLGLAKVVAGLTGLAVDDDLFRRAERARRRKNRFWTALAGVFLLLAILASGSAVYAWQQLKTNEAFLNTTLARATEIVNTAVAQAEKYKVPRTLTLELLAKAEGLLDDMARLGRPTPELRYRKAWMLIEFAHNYAILGDAAKQRATAEDAYRLLAGLAGERPDDRSYQRDLSVAYNEIGDVLVAQGKLDEALAKYRASLEIAERLAASDGHNAGWKHDLSLSYNKVGGVLVAQGKLDEALAKYRAGFDIAERLAASDRRNAGWQHDLALNHANLATLYDKLGDVVQALRELRAGQAISAALVATDPSNAQWKRYITWFDERIAQLEARAASKRERKWPPTVRFGLHGAGSELDLLRNLTNALPSTAVS
jgi:tetratricopeptide (TPR) repeat protein